MYFIDQNCVFYHRNTREKPKDDHGAVAECAALTPHYALVRHGRGPGAAYCLEELMQGGRVIGTFVRSSKGIPVC